MESEEKCRKEEKMEEKSTEKVSPAESHEGESQGQEGSAGQSSGQEETKDEIQVLTEKLNIALKEKEELKKTSDELLDKYLRLRAEMDNFRKRLEKDAEERVEREKGELLKEFLEVIDNFDYFLTASERSKESRKLEPGQAGESDAQDNKELTAFFKGVSMIHQAFLKVLAKEGVTPLDASPGTPFDPRYHEAVDSEELEEKHGTITREVRKGYIYRGKVLRPARVMVAK